MGDLIQQRPGLNIHVTGAIISQQFGETHFTVYERHPHPFTPLHSPSLPPLSCHFTPSPSPFPSPSPPPLLRTSCPGRPLDRPIAPSPSPLPFISDLAVGVRSGVLGKGEGRGRLDTADMKEGDEVSGVGRGGRGVGAEEDSCTPAGGS